MTIPTFFIDDDINLFLICSFLIQDREVRKESVFFVVVPLSLTRVVVFKFLSLVVLVDYCAYSYAVSTVCNFATLMHLSFQRSRFTPANCTITTSTLV